MWLSSVPSLRQKQGLPPSQEGTPVRHESRWSFPKPSLWRADGPSQGSDPSFPGVETAGVPEPELRPGLAPLESWESPGFWTLLFQTPSCLKVLVAQSCPTLCDPVNCSPPGSSVHCASLLQGIFPTQESNPGSPALQADSLPSEYQGSPLSCLALLKCVVCRSSS